MWNKEEKVRSPVHPHTLSILSPRILPAGLRSSEEVPLLSRRSGRRETMRTEEGMRGMTSSPQSALSLVGQRKERKFRNERETGHPRLSASSYAGLNRQLPEKGGREQWGSPSLYFPHSLARWSGERESMCDEVTSTLIAHSLRKVAESEIHRTMRITVHKRPKRSVGKISPLHAPYPRPLLSSCRSIARLCSPQAQATPQPPPRKSRKSRKSWKWRRCVLIQKILGVKTLSRIASARKGVHAAHHAVGENGLRSQADQPAGRMCSVQGEFIGSISYH